MSTHPIALPAGSPNAPEAKRMRTADGEEEVEKKLVLSTRFALTANSKSTATQFAVLLQRHEYIRNNNFKVYSPNAYNKDTCDPKWTRLDWPCRGTLETCKKEECFKTGVPQPECCWRYSFRYQLAEANKSDGCLIQLVEAPTKYVGYKNRIPQTLGNGQTIEKEMAHDLKIKIFRVYAPILLRDDEILETQVEFIQEDIDELVSQIRNWYEGDRSDKSEVSVRFDRFSLLAGCDTPAEDSSRAAAHQTSYDTTPAAANAIHSVGTDRKYPGHSHHTASTAASGIEPESDPFRHWLRLVKRDAWLLNIAPEEFQANKEIVREACRRDGLALRFASEELRDNKGIVLAACRQAGEALEFASQRLRGNRTIVFHACKHSRIAGRALRYASDQLRDDNHLVKTVCLYNGLALEHASERLQDDVWVVRCACQQNGKALQFASKRLRSNKRVVLDAVASDCDSLKFALGGLSQEPASLFASGVWVDYINLAEASNESSGGSLYQQAANLNNKGIIALSKGNRESSITALTRSIKKLKEIIPRESVVDFNVTAENGTQGTRTVAIPVIDSSESAVFNEAIYLPDTVTETPNNAEMSTYSGAVLYNIALAYQSLETRDCLKKAEKLYSVALKVVDSTALNMRTAVIVKLGCLINLLCLRYANGSYQEVYQLLIALSIAWQELPIINNEALLEEPEIQRLIQISNHLLLSRGPEGLLLPYVAPAA